MEVKEEYLVHDDREPNEKEFREECLSGKYSVEQLREWGFHEERIKYYFDLE
ncbi:MAG: hypothetical protein Q3988_06800 [Gemella sp.]|nr:hypothetical protein [Gemella sp.]